MEPYRRQLQLPPPLYIHLPVRVDEDVGHRRVDHQRLDRPEAGHLVLHVLHQTAALGLIDRQPLLVEDALDQQRQFSPELLAG